ncbi:lipocalin family protein [Pedobacter boryungensis]|uniref:Uncharacterized protein n=1 Tax=Pedobacter boryungensis TaxID=869962 RepID=A0ABX2DCS6_9SPHI|nr:lipocalin family protein [Pedobacter boryungensis]NQX31891.1 hypothetical protein [Pedobacter boryungensis]
MRILYFIIGLFLFTSQINAQVLSGTYQQKLLNNEIKITFNGNNFYQIYLDDNIGRTEGYGTYKIENGKLILNFENSKTIDSSKYVLKLSKINNPSILQFSIKVFDIANNNKPFPSAFCALNNFENKMVALYITDTIGKAQLSLYDSKIFKSVVIGSIGYNSVEIPISKIMGNNVVLNVFLNEQGAQNFQKQTVIYYDILKKSNKELILKSKEGKKLNLKWTYTPILE